MDVNITDGFYFDGDFKDNRLLQFRLADCNQFNNAFCAGCSQHQALVTNIVDDSLWCNPDGHCTIQTASVQFRWVLCN